MIKTPFISVDGIIELSNGAGVVLIERQNPPHGWALPGGFVDLGETLTQALVREMKEEVTLDVTIKRLLGIYSSPTRDPRFHTVSAVFVCQAEGQPYAADDAKAVHIIPKEELLQSVEYVFDHRQIITDYLAGKQCVY